MAYRLATEREVRRLLPASIHAATLINFLQKNIQTEWYIDERTERIETGVVIDLANDRVKFFDVLSVPPVWETFNESRWMPLPARTK